MAIIKIIKTLKGAGILANKAAKDQTPDFLRFNLIYGFNGSGKSTLSRVFACLEAGQHHEALPEECSFDIEMDDATTYSAPKKLTGLENRVCVFNTDFIERNLQWGAGRANSIFYISQEQADLVAELKTAQGAVPAGVAAKKAQDDVVKAAEKELKTYRTERAKLVSRSLHLGNRRYEAGQLQADCEKLPYGPESVLADDALNALVSVAELSAPPPTLEEIKIDVPAIHALIENARHFGDVSIGQVILEELEKHPSMVPWMKEGHDYHTSNALEACLLCGNALTNARKEKLAAALDDKIAALLTDLEAARVRASSLLETALGLPTRWPKAAELDLSLQADYAPAYKAVADSFGGMQAQLKEAGRIVAARLTQPTTAVAHALPTTEDLEASGKAFVAAVATANTLIGKHNTATADFAKRQDDAREANHGAKPINLCQRISMSESASEFYPPNARALYAPRALVGGQACAICRRWHTFGDWTFNGERETCVIRLRPLRTRPGGELLPGCSAFRRSKFSREVYAKLSLYPRLQRAFRLRAEAHWLPRESC